MRENFAGEENLDVITGAFEDVDLAPGAYDVVFAATAFYWLDPTLRVRKAVDLLAPGGVLATLSTIEIRSEVDRGFFERTSTIYRRYRPDERRSESPTEAETGPGDFDEFRSNGLLADVEVRRYRWDQTYTTGDYEQLVRSYSDTQTMEATAREGLLADLRDLIEVEFGGEVVRPLVIVLTLGRRRPTRAA
jgi:SAM-dependent methyltransferase